VLNKVRNWTRTFWHSPFLDFPGELNFYQPIKAQDLQLQRYLTTNYRKLDKVARICFAPVQVLITRRQN